MGLTERACRAWIATATTAAGRRRLCCRRASYGQAPSYVNSGFAPAYWGGFGFGPGLFTGFLLGEALAPHASFADGYYPGDGNYGGGDFGGGDFGGGDF